MKPLTLEETRLKEEVKHDCFWDNIHYKNPEAEKVFKLICHLEDFEVQYWELQKENKQIKEKLDKYENPDDMTLMYMWCTEKVKDENKKLQERVEYLERSNNRREDIVLEQRQQIELLEHYKTLYQSLKGQKEEFIKWLEDNWKETQDIWYIKILQKYKGIIGDVKNEYYNLLEEKMSRLINENEALKQKYLNAVADYETTMFEKEQLNSLVNSCQEEHKKLKKQVEEYKDKINWYENFEVNKTIDKLRLKHNTQQKDFIKYLEDESKEIYRDGGLRQNIFRQILQKYKEIIGGKHE